MTFFTYEAMLTGASGKPENALQSSDVKDSCPFAEGTVCEDVANNPTTNNAVTIKHGAEDVRVEAAARESSVRQTFGNLSHTSNRSRSTVDDAYFILHVPL